MTTEVDILNKVAFLAVEYTQLAILDELLAIEISSSCSRLHHFSKKVRSYEVLADLNYSLVVR